MRNTNKKRETVVLVALSAAISACSVLLAHQVATWGAMLCTTSLCIVFAIFWERLSMLKGAHEHELASRVRQERLADVYRDTTEALAGAIAAKDSYEQDHVCRVRAICELVATQMGLSADKRDGISVAALLHDVGKLGVPEYILLKPGPLNQDEFAKTSNHAATGAGIIQQVNYPWDVAAMVRHHHERFDGTGYPDHLSGEAIELGARIIAVAEVYDSLISDRCYRSGWPHKRAIEHIKQLVGTHFDPNVVMALVEVEAAVEAIAGNRLCVEPEPQNLTAKGENLVAADMIAQASKELMSLFEIAETISSTLELPEVLGLLAHRTKRLLHASSCAVFLNDKECKDVLTCKMAVGHRHEALRRARITVGRGVTGKAISSGNTYVGDYDRDDLTFPAGKPTSLSLKSCLVVPIVHLDQIVGTINLYDVAVNAFSQEHVQMMTVVASRAAVAIQNASSFETVRDSAMKDPLTGLYNGRYLHSFLEHEISRASRNSGRLSLIGLDLDNFKAVNDSFGHCQGDKVLMDMATIFTHQVRDYDLVARHGGDEFIIVLPDTPADEAAVTGERIRQEVHDYAFKTLGHNAVNLGISVGVASFPDDASDLETLLEAADAAMYRDKRARKQGQLAA